MNKYSKRFLDWKAIEGWCVYETKPEVTYWNYLHPEKLNIEQLHEYFKKKTRRQTGSKKLLKTNN